MIITHKINMDLANKGIAPKFDMVQGDFCARQIEFRLFSNNTPWTIPDGVLVLIRYRRPDKSVGSYNTLPDRTSAYTITGSNTLAITVAPEALAIPGSVTLVVSLSTREQELSTFEVQIEVQPNLTSGPVLDGNYASITGMLPIPDNASAGQMLLVDTVSNGKVRTVKAVDIPKEIPDYVTTEANRLAARALGRQHDNTFSFLAGADIHARTDFSEGKQNTEQMLASTKHAAQAMDIIHKRTHMDFGAILGDILDNSGETPSQAQNIYLLVHEYFHPAFVGMPQFWLKGEDDYLVENNEMTDGQVYAGITIHNSDAMVDDGHKIGGYCYKDFDRSKIRVICLALPEDGRSINAAQVTWLNHALNLSGKGTGWNCLILSHMPIGDFSGNASLINTIISNEDHIIANIHGHTHNYQTGFVPNTSIPQISIPCISPYLTKDKHGNTGPTIPYQKTPNSSFDTSFCVVTIDQAQRVIYVDHYGAGEDRIVSY